MLRNQRGATLLEAILAAAIMGWVLAYVGTQLRTYALNQQIEHTARKIVFLNSEIKTFMKEMFLKTSAVNAATGKNEVIPNPIYTETRIGKTHFANDLNWVRKVSCTPSGDLPDNLLREYVSCNYSSDLFGLWFIGVYIDFVKYDELFHPEIKRFPKSAWELYVNTSNDEIGDFFSIINRIVNVKAEDGTYISEDKIMLGEFTTPGPGRVVLVEGSGRPLSSLVGSNIKLLDDYIKAVTSGRNTAGVYIPIINENEPGEIYLQADGLVPINLGAKLCWSSKTGKKQPCIRGVTDVNDKANFLVAESGFAFGIGLKRTPVEAAYRTFVNNEDVFMKYLDCPWDKADLYMNNKIAVFSSSFSSGSESTSTFVNPSDIVSKGTKGAHGKHAMVSGVSLEWNPDQANQGWIISGAIGFDAAFAADNNADSVLRNPNSMSFIVLQWCEEEV